MQKRKNTSCEDETTFDYFFEKWGKNWTNVKHLFKWSCKEVGFYPFTRSKFTGKIKTIYQIYQVNQKESENTIKQLIFKYFDSSTQLMERLIIKYGPNADQIYKNKLKEKSKTKITIASIQYWLNKGFSLEEAQKQKKEYYNKLSKLGVKRYLETMAVDPLKKKKMYEKISKTKKERRNKEYWLNLGYSDEEAKNKVNSYLPPVHSLENYIKKYGPENGRQKHKKFYETTKQSRIKRFGTAIQSGYVSKSSIKFFIPLYKQLRKNGFLKNDIVWGIGKRREFTTYDTLTKRNYAFDFVVKSKKIILEYNDPFWHARSKEEWKNPIFKYETSLERDECKKLLAKKIGFNIIYIWSDNLPPIEYIKNIILSNE